MLSWSKASDGVRKVPGHPMVISCDMALNKKVVRILDSRPGLKAVIPRLEKLHTSMAAIRALGSSVECSGINNTWRAADVYGPTTHLTDIGMQQLQLDLSMHTSTPMRPSMILLSRNISRPIQITEDL